MNTTKTATKKQISFTLRMTKIDAAKLATLEEIDAAWSANLGPDGRIRNLAFSRRLAARERELAISILGFAPEDGTAETRYTATGTELRKWAEEKKGEGR